MDASSSMLENGHQRGEKDYTLIEKLPVAQLLKNFPTFYETRKFITMLT
jgi:hypothetical protein